MTRSDPNWFAAGCALVYLLLFLFLPFYSFYGALSLNGITLLSLSPVCALVLVAGIAMILAALLTDYRISIGVGCVALIVTLCFGVMGNSVLSSNALVSLAGSLLADSGYGNITRMITIPMGVGSYLCMGLCIGYIVLEIVLRPRRRHNVIRPDDFGQDKGFVEF
ncbi:MAG: hypothetical protein ACI4O7_02910 [Aristaeellaceae bacterium]